VCYSPSSDAFTMRRDLSVRLQVEKDKRYLVKCAANAHAAKARYMVRCMLVCDAVNLSERPPLTLRAIQGHRQRGSNGEVEMVYGGMHGQ
ncbi:hypothetical protein KIPB_014405, partial [Kipferlia bialata]